MPFPAGQLVALIIAVSFAAGLNVYATVATLGLLAHTKYLVLPPQLDALSDWWVIGAALVLFAVGFVADKIPALDLVWNALHTFIRVPVAALMAYQATASLSLGAQLAATLMGGAIALIAHGGKTAAHAAIAPSPEPFSNIVLSMGGDALSVFLTWMATWKPYVAAGITLVLVVITLVVIPLVWHGLRNLFHRGKRKPAASSQ